MPRMNVLNSLEQSAFESPPLFNSAERKRCFDFPLALQVAGGRVNAEVGAMVNVATNQDITLRNLVTDFAVGAASSGAAGLGKLANLAQITNTRLGRTATAGEAEVYKVMADSQITVAQTVGYAVGATALNSSRLTGKTGAALA